MKNILWLASWYPNRADRFDGDFIQRHALAVSQFCKVQVLYVVKSITGKGVEEKVTGNLTETIIYYRPFSTGISPLDRFISHQQYKKEYRRAIAQYIKINGRPHCVHVHVAMKAGLMALWMNRKWAIPYIVTEHWTGYLPEADIRIDSFSGVYRQWIGQVLEKASYITVVSDHLGKAIQKYFPALRFTVVPNVVDTRIFFPADQMVSEGFQLIHVSNMNYQKNTEAILDAMSIVKQDHPFIKLHLYGPVHGDLQARVKRLQLEDNVFFKGEVAQDVLATAMQRANALILYSRFETFGCVIIEAYACGVPVIVSDIEVFHELVTEGVNGLFVKPNDPAELAGVISNLVKGKLRFDPNSIAAVAAEKYNYGRVGKQLDDIYGLLPAKEDG